MGGFGSGKMPEGAIVKLDGTVTNPDGTITKTKLFDFLEIDLDDYSDIQMTAAEAQHFTNHVRRMRTGLSAFVPKLCPGIVICPVGNKCPFKERQPVGRQCLLETTLVKIKTREYVESLDIDPGSPYQMSLIDRLVELDIFEYRSNIGLSQPEDSSLLKTIETTSKDGEVIESLVVHPYLQAKESFHRKRMQILEALVATPREEYKQAAAIKKKNTEGVSSQLSELRKTIDKLQKSGPRSIDGIIKDAEKINKSKIVEADWEEIMVKPVEEDNIDFCDPFDK
jgi:hypothetical protein